MNPNSLYTGSIQTLERIPDRIRRLFRNASELDQNQLFRMSADRGLFICQSQSLNLHVTSPNVSKLVSFASSQFELY
jgi:ribonucleotide reductase alpha subunit